MENCWDIAYICHCIGWRRRAEIYSLLSATMLDAASASLDTSWVAASVSLSAAARLLLPLRLLNRLKKPGFSGRFLAGRFLAGNTKHRAKQMMLNKAPMPLQSTTAARCQQTCRAAHGGQLSLTNMALYAQNCLWTHSFVSVKSSLLAI